jgi:4-alpha-glucanotransferase
MTDPTSPSSRKKPRERLQAGPPSSPKSSPRAAPLQPPTAHRTAGVTIPLFSIRTPRSWGIGEIGDLPEFAALMKRAGLSLVQLLPLHEISGAETSPYASLSAFGIDPIAISIADMPEIQHAETASQLGSRPTRTERDALGSEGVHLLSRARTSTSVEYEIVRRLKKRAFAFAFKRFLAEDVARGSARARAYLDFVEAERDWLDDYALFRALKDAHEGRAWWDWTRGLAERAPDDLARARMDLAPEILFYAYLQWVAHEQWRRMRAELRTLGVEVMGDLPFMVGRDSVDVWANPDAFKRDASVGVPGDAFSEDGQDWDLPPYHWEAMQRDGYAWLHRRARYTGSLYDRFRIDHLVGFYRTYQRLREGKRNAAGRLVPGIFDPDGDQAQLAHGEAVVTAMVRGARESGARLVAEDLGTVPDWVRASLGKLGVPGYKVVIWEKDGLAYRDPAAFPAVSVACFATHDTDPVAAWWEGLDPKERAAVGKIPGLSKADLGKSFTADVHGALCDLLSESGSELVLFLFQDLIGQKHRINTPGTTGADNWSFRMPATVEECARNPGILAKLQRVREAVERGRRAPPV